MQNKDKYITKDQARTMLENLPKGGTPDGFIDAMKSKGYTFEGLEETQPVKAPGFLDRLKESASHRLDRLKESASQGIEGVKKADSEYYKSTTEGAPISQQATDAVGVLGAVGKGITDVGSTVINAIPGVEPTLNAITSTAKAGIEGYDKNVIQPAGQAIRGAIGAENVDAVAKQADPVAQAVLDYTNQPNIQKNIESTKNIITGILTVVGAKQMTEGSINLAKNIKSKTPEIKIPPPDSPPGKAFVENISSKAAGLGLSPETAGKVFKSYVANTSGVSPLSQDFIAATAKAGKFDEMFSNDILTNPRPTEMKVLQDVATKLDDVVGEKGVIGAGYKGVLDATKPFKFSRQELINDIVDSTKLKYDIKKGFYKTADTADIAQGDLIKLNNLLDTYKGVKTLDGNQFKVLRSAIKDLAYDNGLKSVSGERIAKNLYSKVNEKYRTNVKGLQELDTKFADAIDNIDEIKSYFTKDSQGNLVLKDNAERQLSALLERGNERKLATVKQFVPDIEERIAYANTLRNLDAAQGNLIGNYGKTGGNLAAGAIGTVVGGPVGGVAAFLANLYASNPINVTKAIGRFYRPADLESSSIINNAAAKSKTKANDIKPSLPQNKKITSGKVIPKELQPLAEEAKKYKSAEDFIKGQGNEFYHGTTKGNSFSKFDMSKADTGVGTNINDQGNQIYLTTSKDAAKWFSKMAESKNQLSKGTMDFSKPEPYGDVLDFLIDKKAKVLKVAKMPRGEEEAAKLIGKIKSQGYDAVEFPDEGFNTIEGQMDVANLYKNGKPPSSVIVLNEKVLKSKQQLIDLWNKANGKK